MREIFQRFSGSMRSMKQMEQPKASSSTPNHKPHFFKFLFPDPFANLCIPKKFYKHLPAVPPKRASLVTTQTDKFWRVDVCQNEEGICFSRGWPEFAEAHHLQIGYLVVFRYEGKMVFNVQVFDTTSCIKDYSLTPCKPPNFKFDSSKFVDLTSDVQVKSEGETQIPVASGRKRKSATGKAQLVGEEDWQEGKPIIKKKKLIQKISLQDYSSTPCKPPNFKFDSSKFVDLTSDVQIKSEGETQIPVASGRKRKSATGKAQLVGEEDWEEGKPIIKKKKLIQKISLQDCSTTPCKPPTFKFDSSKFVDLTSDVQVKSEGETQIPVASGRKRKSATGKAQLVGEEDWEEGKPIIKKKKLIQKISLQDCSTTPCKPPTFKFDSSKFVDLTSDVQVKSEGEIQFPVASGRKRSNATDKAQLVGEEDSEEEEKPIIKNRVQKILTQRSNLKMTTVPQFEKTLGCTSTTRHRKVLYIPKKFCVENGLVSERTMFLKNSKGKKWRVKFMTRRKPRNVGMLTVGWRVFSTENGIKKGDDCIFKLIDKKTFLVDVV